MGNEVTARGASPMGHWPGQAVVQSGLCANGDAAVQVLVGRHHHFTVVILTSPSFLRTSIPTS